MAKDTPSATTNSSGTPPIHDPTTITKTTTKLQPVTTLDTPLARTYTYLHPLLLLGSLYIAFPTLVKDPIGTLTNALLPLGVLSALNVALTLPSANEIAYRSASMSATASATAGAGGDGNANAGEKKKRKQAGKKDFEDELGWGTQIVPAILSLFLSLTAGPPLVATALILFGAPFTTHQFQTMLAGAHIALLAGLPLIYVHGVEARIWMDIVALKVPIDETLGGALGTLVGAWIGAVPIPLDWDRNWQKWPVTVVTGAYAGYAVGKVLGGTLGKGRYIKF